MVAANLQPITGKDGYIALINSVSTPTLASEPCGNVLQLPGGSLAYAANQAFQVTARTKKVLDPRMPLVVSNNAVIVKKTDYKVLWGSGTILFRKPLSGTPVITISGNYMPTASGTDVYGLDHLNNWQLNLTTNQIQADEYNTDMVPEFRGKFAGTWQFERYASTTGMDIWNLMMLQEYFILALYESLQEDRIWIIYGDFGAQPLTAPGTGMINGTVTGSMKVTPAYLFEPL